MNFQEQVSDQEIERSLWFIKNRALLKKIIIIILLIIILSLFGFSLIKFISIKIQDNKTTDFNLIDIDFAAWHERNKLQDLIIIGNNIIPLGNHAVIETGNGEFKARCVIAADGSLGAGAKMLGSDGLLATVLTQHKESSGLLEGILATDFSSNRMPLTSFGKKALKKYRSLYDTPANSYTVMGAEGYALMLNALNRCVTPGDRECINRMIRSTIGFSGITGRITINPDGKAIRPLVVNSIKKGRQAFIVKVY